MKRRTLLASAALLAGCSRDAPSLWDGQWLGAQAERGHRLRQGMPAVSQVLPRRAQVVVIGGGIAALACARALRERRIDVAVLELDDHVGGNSRAHTLAGTRCPLGAHYLPLPGPQAREVSELLHALGIARQHLGRTIYDDTMLCHSPQERVFFEGQWHDGLLPPARNATAKGQRDRFAAAVGEAMRMGFAVPTARAPWTAAHAALDAQPFAQWLDAQGLHDPVLRTYLDHCCRDDYGAGLTTVSAWAGLHYFASRHGFGGDGDMAEAHDAVLTWPEGNAYLAERMATPLADALHTGRVVQHVQVNRHSVSVLAWEAGAQRWERWDAARAVLATPLHVSQHLWRDGTPAALTAAARQLPQAPWLVANIALHRAPLERLGSPPAWDNVRHGSPWLGYVHARHQQRTRSVQSPVLTLYKALPASERAALLRADWRATAQAALDELAQLHPAIEPQVQRIDLMRWGHAMAVPAPGVRSSPHLTALAQPHGRLHFAHSDLSGYSVFEEAYTHGVRAAREATA